MVGDRNSEAWLRRDDIYIHSVTNQSTEAIHKPTISINTHETRRR